MTTSLLLLLGLAALTAAYAYRRTPRHVTSALGFARAECVPILLRLPFALAAALCIAELIPDRVIAGVLGPDTGLGGIVAASLLGGLLPGGPIVTFPIAIVFAREGAGGPQVVALLTGWSIYAFHRVLIYEGPIMGWRFTALRLACSWFAPPMAGIAAGLVATALGVSLAVR